MLFDAMLKNKASYLTMSWSPNQNQDFHKQMIVRVYG